MASKSFYDLDFIIEMNERRLEQYTSAYQKILERLTNLIIIYSAITIFLVPIVQDIFLLQIRHWFLYLSFGVFIFLFLISIFFTVKLVIPVEVAYLEIPKKYYEEYRLLYEQTIKNTQEVEKLLKASYINELETALETNDSVFRKKSSFYYNSLLYVLLSVIPYLICVGFHISKRDDKIQKVRVLTSELNIKLQEIITMANKSDNKVGGSSTTTTTKLPGINPAQVIASFPMLIRENSQFSSTKKNR